MKILENKTNEYNLFCQKYSIDIEYDTVLKYAKKLTDLLEIHLNNVDEKDTKRLQKILDDNYKEACFKADVGVTMDMHRRALELLTKFWKYGNLIKKHKL